MAVRSLAGVFEIPHPGYLHYKAFDKSKRSILIPTLGLMREPPAPPRETPGANTIEGLRDLVLKAVRKASGNADLEFTEDGDLPLRFGSAAVLVRVLDDPPCVRVFSPVLENVEADDRLVESPQRAEFRGALRAVLRGGRERLRGRGDVRCAICRRARGERLLAAGQPRRRDTGRTLQKEFGGRTGFEDAREEPEVQ